MLFSVIRITPSQSFIPLKNSHLNFTNTKLRVSVRELVEQAMQQGDLKGSFISSKRALEGTFGHQILQNRRGESYRREVRIAYEVTGHPSGIALEIQGRIDGVFKQNGLYTIEEIKTTHLDLAELELSESGVHFAQAKLYGYLFLENAKLEQVIVSLTYYQLKTTETKVFAKSFSKEELERFFKQIVDGYLEKIKELFIWQEIRNRSAQSLPFPFPVLRHGQELFMSEVTQAIAEGHNLFAQAPTGLGKTISVLYPTIKAMAAGRCAKIFYLTARTTTREAPEQALEKLRAEGLRLKSVVITAKEKTCLQDEMICSPEACEYLYNYFGKIQGAIRDIFSQDRFGREQIETCAKKHKVCPFELSLELSLLADCVICDYNYFFDPRVQLARYDSEVRQPYVYLVDEAHNLVERSREMYSATLEKSRFLACKRLVDKKHFPELFECLTIIDNCLLNLRKNGFVEESKEDVKDRVPVDLTDYLIDFLEPAEQALTSREYLPFREALLELYFQVTFFLKINQLQQESAVYSVISYRQQSELTIKLACLDASGMLRKKIAKAQTTIFFSATLTPADYFSKLLGGGEGDRTIQLPSPFPASNRCLCLVDHVSTRYRDRIDTFDQIADYLAVYVRQRPGNFLIFFPSYQYLSEVYNRCQHLARDVTLLRQETGMSETEREAFLAEFCEKREQPVVGFVIMGGIFGESIDLPGDRLTGAAIIGVGLPQVNLERNLIRQYHDTQSSNGFHYAYTYPGMNKVLQAAGRLIRTETDKGSLLLIDDRFATPLYQRLFPPEWKPIHIIRDSETLTAILAQFWQ